MALQPGDVVDERYRLLAKIGEGAHGVVFRARDLESREEVAIKFLKRELGLNSEYAQRMGREAVAMAQLRGTHAVYVHGMRQATDGTRYLVMEMLHGQNLEQFLQAAEARGGRLKVAKMLEMLRPVVDTLEAAHGQGIIHRDLKPANIFVIHRSAGGGVRLLDFGLVKLVEARGMTADGMVAGSPSYIAPEGWKGDPSALDHRIDVYALGVVIFRALASRVPFSSKSIVELMEWALAGPRPSLRQFRPKLPPEVDPWMAKCLAVEPDDRYQSVRQMWSALETIMGTQSRSPY